MFNENNSPPHMTTKAKQLDAILVRLLDGRMVKLRFPSERERELFRQSLYKAKRDLDNTLMLSDDDYIPKKMRYNIHCSYPEGPGWYVEITFISDDDQKPFTFELVEND